MKAIAELLAEHPFFEGLPADTLAELAGCAVLAHLEEGDILFHEGDRASAFSVVRSGRVAVRAHNPAGGGVIIDTADAGQVVGWSALVPPHRWLFDAIASESSSVVSFDATCLLAKCERDPAVGYAVMTRVATAMYARLDAARVRLLDMYGGGRERNWE